MVRAPGVSSICSPTSSSTSAGRPGQRRDATVQRLGEVQFAAHGGLGDLGDGRVRTDLVGQHLDDLALDQRRVDVEDDEPLGPSRQAVVLQRDVDTLVDGDPRQRGLQLAVDAAGRHRDPQLQSGHRVVGDAADEVDVDAERGHLTGHHAERLGGDRPAEHDDGVGGRLAASPACSSLRSIVTSSPTPWMAALDLVAQLATAGHLGRARYQHAQRQPAADDDLFDVEQLHLVPRKHFEQRRGHARLIDSGDGDQHRHLAACSRLAGPRAPTSGPDVLVV